MIETFAVEGCTIHFVQHGPPEAPVVVLSHGATLDRESWAQQIPVLAERYRVIAWDMRGHGQSRPAGGEITLERLAEDLRGLLDHLGIDRVALVGLSLGSYASQEFGSRHPERVAALASLDATSVTDTRMSGAMRWAMSVSHIALWLYPYRMLVRATAQGAAVTPEARAYIERTVSRLSKREYIATWAAVQTGLRQEPDYREPFPLLIAAGEKDDIGITRSGAVAWGEARPEAVFHMIPGAGHCANQDNPGYVNAMLLDFLAAHWPAG
jgi:3-oxoadipate enol-lactonase